MVNDQKCVEIKEKMKSQKKTQGKNMNLENREEWNWCGGKSYQNFLSLKCSIQMYSQIHNLRPVFVGNF